MSGSSIRGFHSILNRRLIRGTVRRTLSVYNGLDGQSKDELLLDKDLCLPGIHLDEVDKLMEEGCLKPMERYYPNLYIEQDATRKPFEGHNLMVIQPWLNFTNIGPDNTDPDIQLEECVSLGNTIHNWKVVDKKIIFSQHIHKKHVFGPKTFAQLKDHISSQPGVSAVFFGVELLSAIQLGTIEKELQMPVFDRFTVVLNIFRQHARTREAKIQLALAEIPYIKSHLREIHQSAEYQSSANPLKMLVGGSGEKQYHQRLAILKKREQRLKSVLTDLQRQREINRKSRRKLQWPVVSVVGYTNSGKTSLIKHLTADESLQPRNQLFATLDVTIHKGQLPSCKDVFYVDTVGFISKVPKLLVDAFSVTLQEVRESDLILHILDVTHPDWKLQYTTVMKSLTSLQIPNLLLSSKITVGNKMDLIDSEDRSRELVANCDINISILKNINIDRLVNRLDKQLKKNLDHEEFVLRVENGGMKYSWLMRNTSIINCEADENDANYLICRVSMSPVVRGRWKKLFGELSGEQDVQ